MLKLTPQQKLIVDYLQDGEWHCMATRDFFIKDDRKRISELNAIGYAINGKFCDGRCGIKHSSRIFMRQMSKKPIEQLTYLGTNTPYGSNNH